MHTTVVKLLSLFLLTFFSTGTTLFAQTNQDSHPQDGKEESVALVLGGGGAKGAAHVGVLKVIEEAGIHPDIIVGTSIGAIVGGLYSIGYSPAQLDTLFHSQRWLQLFSREAINGNAIKQMLDSLVLTRTPLPLGEGAGVRRFACIAADLRTLSEVVLADDSLSRNMRASMAIPALFKPVRYDDLVLYDGGLINNLPVDIARKMGADIVIAVDLTVNQHEDESDDGNDLKNILDELFDIKNMKGLFGWLLNRPDFKKYRENKSNSDIYIHPNLEGYAATDFSSKYIHTMMVIGEREARQHINALRSLRHE